ncbi:MAG TPA: hypothetical protein VMB78_03480 [Dissulfurispiraceae bacterium]|nr:hypothetical protein [Dissulfurispiraceae bacterium]
MICPACGRLMLNKLTFFKCSNGFCDYEEDVEPQLQPIDPEPLRAAHFLKHAAPAKCRRSRPDIDQWGVRQFILVSF